jgi:predicted Zn-dependent peptidase
MKSFSNYYFPKLKTYHLSNGLTIIWNPRKEMNHFEVQAIIKTGSAQEPAGKSGLAHLLEHLILFSPTKSFPTPERISRFTNQIGGWINGEINYFSLELEADFPLETFPQGIDLLKEKIFYPHFQSDIIKAEKNRIFQEIRSRKDSPEIQILDLLYEERAKEKNSALRNQVGSEKAISRITKTDLQEFHQKISQPSNVLFIISGPSSFEKSIKTKIVPILEKIKKRKRSLPPLRKLSFSDSLKKNYFRKDVQETYFSFSFPLEPFSSSEERKLQTLHHLLNDSEDSINSQIRKKGLAYHIETDHFLLPDKAFFYFFGHTKSLSQVKQIFNFLHQELEKSSSPFLTPSLFHYAKRQYLLFSLTDYESPVSTFFSIKNHFLKTGNFLNPRQEIKERNSISISQMKELASRLFSSSQVNILTIGKEK